MDFQKQLSAKEILLLFTKYPFAAKDATLKEKGGEGYETRKDLGSARVPVARGKRIIHDFFERVFIRYIFSLVAQAGKYCDRLSALLTDAQQPAEHPRGYRVRFGSDDNSDHLGVVDTDEERGGSTADPESDGNAGFAPSSPFFSHVFSFCYYLLIATVR